MSGKRRKQQQKRQGSATRVSKEIYSRRPSASVLPNDGYMVGWRSSDDGMAVCGVVEGANVNRSTVEGDELVGGGDSMIGT